MNETKHHKKIKAMFVNKSKLLKFTGKKKLLNARKCMKIIKQDNQKKIDLYSAINSKCTLLIFHDS